MDGRGRIAALALVVALAVAACGGDDGDGDEATVRAAIEAFEARAEAEGYTVDKDGDEDDDELKFESEECKEFDAAFPDADGLPGQTANAESESFSRGELIPGEGSEETLEAMAGTVGDPDDLTEMFELLRDDRMVPCMQEALEHTFNEDAELEEVELGEVRVEVIDVERVGDDAVSVRVGTTMGTSGLTFPIAFDFTMARQGRAAVMVGAATIGGEDIAAPVAELARSVLGDIQVD